MKERRFISWVEAEMMSMVFGIDIPTSEEQMFIPKEQTKPKRPKQDIVVYKRSERRCPKDGKK